MTITDPLAVIIIAATFLLAGCVKGVIGLGLPTISLALLTVSFGLVEAMALLLMPSFVTNLWQAFSGGQVRRILTRLWPFLLLAGATVWLGAISLVQLPRQWLVLLLGVLVLLYCGANLAGLRLQIPKEREIWLGPLMGGINGVLTGMTGSFVVPGVLYLQALGLPRDMLVQAMGWLFTISTVALAIALQGHGFLSWNLTGASMAAVLPALLGMVLGQRMRQRLSEAQFRRLFFVALAALGLAIIINAYR